MTRGGCVLDYLNLEPDAPKVRVVQRCHGDKFYNLLKAKSCLMVSSSVVIELIILQISVAFSPGLIIALIVNESVQKSRKNGLQVAGGAATGAIFITIITAGVVIYF